MLERCYAGIPMLTPPAITDETINACLRDNYDLRVLQTTFLPLGNDINTAVFRVMTDRGLPYFLKLRRGNFDEVAVDVPAFLHAQGIRRIMAPLATNTHRLSVRAHGFDWMVYPFMEGRNGWEVPLSQAQWIALGETVRAIHTTALSPELRQRVAHEVFGSRYRDSVRRYDQEVIQGVYLDPISQLFAEYWIAQRDQIFAIVDRADHLAHVLHERPHDLVVCHSDMHAGNILVGADGEFAIVDWDEPIMAPKERDLMFVDGGFYGDRNPDQEAAWFYAGYGSTTIDPLVLAYYRYERIVMDFDAYAQQIFDLQGSAVDRAGGLRQLMDQFRPKNVVEFAHRTFRQLP